MASEKRILAPVTLESAGVDEMSRQERIKQQSQGLFFVAGKDERHALTHEVDALERGERATVSSEAAQLTKFFGVYAQRGRGERGRKTDDHFFMVRISNPAGGGFAPAQWSALAEASGRFADGTLRITSRQAIQFHHVYGPQLAPLVRYLNRYYRSSATLGACGDVNRNVACSPIEGLDPVHRTGGRELALQIADELVPRTSAYFQVFLSDPEGRSLAPVNPHEPLYGEQYLPRKFKIAIAHPGDNSVDALTQDIALVPVVENGRADGAVWDLYSGGGLGLTHNNPRTAALLGLYLGRIRREQVVDAAKAILVIQKENGERRDRKLARWKYTLRRLGLEAVKAELEGRFHLEIEPAIPQPLPPMNLHLGWHRQRGGASYYGLSVESGRVQPGLRKALRAAVEEFQLSVRLTPQQDLLLCDVRDRAALERVLTGHGVRSPESVSIARANAMACPAKPTCGLAMTEAERVLPSYLDAIEAAGLGDVDAVIRMTGCPNNCARSPTAEIGIYGYGKDEHVILVGGSRSGTRIGRELYRRLPEEKMVPALVGIFAAIRDRNEEGLPAGEFLYRTDPEQLRRWIGVEDGRQPCPPRSRARDIFPTAATRP
jgi:sulfite reductase (ferredoxin)